jgi:excisionase family DNA binding protein
VETTKGPLAVSVADAAKLVGISRAAIYPIIMGGKIESFTVGARRLVAVESLRAWMADQLAAARGGRA